MKLKKKITDITQWSQNKFQFTVMIIFVWNIQKLITFLVVLGNSFKFKENDFFFPLLSENLTFRIENRAHINTYDLN